MLFRPSNTAADTTPKAKRGKAAAPKPKPPGGKYRDEVMTVVSDWIDDQFMEDKNWGDLDKKVNRGTT